MGTTMTEFNSGKSNDFFSEPGGAAPEHAPEASTHVVVIDTSVEGYESLVKNAPSGAEIILLDGNDGFAALAKALEGHEGIDTLEILSHGDTGEIILGAETLSLATIDDHSEVLTAIKSAMANGGDILLYGCNVGEGGEGVAFVEAVAAATGADVAASDDLTGSEALGGDWSLEYSTGDILTAGTFSAINPEFANVLGPSPGTITWTSTATPVGTSYTQDPSTTNIGSSGLDVAFNTSGGSGGRFSLANASGTQHAATSGTDITLRFEIDISGGSTVDDIRLTSTDGAEFQLDEFVFGYSSTSSSTVTFTGWRDGSQVATLSYDTTNNTQGTGTSGHGIISFGADWENIDEIRVTSSNATYNVAFDDIVITAAVAGNTAPVITLPTTPTVSEDDTNVAIANDIQITDGESDSQTVTLTITGGTASLTTTGLSFTTGDGTNDSSMVFSGTLTDVNNALDSLTFTPTANLSGTNAGSIQIQTNDGNGGTDDQTVTFNIAAVNDAPTVSNLVADLTVTEETATNLDLSAVTFADVDGDALTVTLSVDAGTFSTPADGSGSSVTATLVNPTTITLVGTAANIESYLTTASNIQYTSAQDVNGQDQATLTITPNDGTVDGTAATANIDITGVNDDPSISGLVSDLSFTEDTPGNVNLSAATIVDPDSGTITLTITASEGTFSTPADGSSIGFGVTATLVDSTTITLAGARDDITSYLGTASNIQWQSATDDNGDNTSTFTLTANDGDGSGDVVVGTVNADVTEANDAPVLNPAFTPVLTAISEDIADGSNTGDLVSDIVANGSITDIDGSPVEAIAVTAVDNSNGTWQFSTDGGTNWTPIAEGTTSDSNALLLDSTDMLRFVPGGNYSGSSSITFRAWDKTGLETAGTFNDVSTNGGTTPFSSATDTASVTVTAVNDVPVFANLDGTPTFIEGGSAVQLDANATISDQELDSLNGGNGDYSGASLTIARNGGANADDTLSIVSGGNLTVAGGPNGGGTITAGGNTIATISNAGDDDELTITFANNGTTPTTALVNEVMQAIRYSNSSDTPDASVQLDWTFSDGNSADAQGTGDNPGTASGSVTVSVTGTNDAPTLTATGQNPTFTEGGSAADLYSGPTVSTIESGQTITGMTLTVTNVNDGADETLTFDGSTIQLTNGNVVTTATNGLSVSVVVAGSTATVSFTGATLTTAEAQTLVDGLAYANASDNPTTGANRVVTITGITDSGGTTNGGSDASAPNLASTVSLTGVNDEPVIGNVNGESASIVNNDGAQDVDIFNDATVTNVDSVDYNGGSLTLSQNLGTFNGSWAVDGINVTSGGDGTISAGETISVGGTDIGIVHATSDGQGGNTLIIEFNTADSTSANIQTLVQNLEYGTPSGLGLRTFLLTINDGDGIANGGDEDTFASFIINVTGQPPVISNVDTDSFTYTEGDGATLLDVGSNATLTDADSANFDGGNITVSYQSGQQAEDRIEIDTSGTVSLSAGMTAGSTVSIGATAVGSIEAGSTGGASEDLTITFNSNATPALVQDLIRALQYNNTGGDNPTDGDRVVRISVTDAGSNAATGTADITVNVNPVNDAPTVANLVSDLSVTEDTASNLDLSAVTFADGEGSDLTVTLSIDAGTFSAPADGTGDSVTATLVNPTTITLVGSAANIEAYLTTASNIKYTGAQDVNGQDQATLTITPNDGTVDGTAATANIDITAVNDVPTLGGTPADDGATEDVATAIDLSDYNVADVEGSTITLTLAVDRGTIASTDGDGTTGGVTVANSGTGSMTLSGSATDLNAYLNDTSKIEYTTDLNDTTSATLTVTPNDSTDDGAADTVTISITPVNDEPTLTATGSDPAFTEGGAAADIFNTVAASTIETGQTFSSLTLTVTNVSDTGSEILNIDGTAVTLDDAETNTTATNSLTYNVSVTNGTATVTLTGGTMDATELQTLVDGLSYENTSTNPTDASDRVVTITSVTDSGGTANSGDDTAALTLSSTVSVTAVNNAPGLDSTQSPTLTAIDEDQTDSTGDTVDSILVVNSITDGDGSPVEAIAVTSVDADKGTWQFSTNGGTSWTNINAGTVNDNNALLLDSTDMLRFVPNADENGTETITFRAWDKSTGTAGTFADADPNGGTTAFSATTDTASVTVNPVNDDPTASLPASVTVTEETASDVDLSAADFGDIDSATITVTLSADAGTFSAPADGAGVGGGVTATLVNSTTITLAGAPDDIDTYLDTTANIQYTSEVDADTAGAATITVTANDGDGSGDVSLGTVNVDVTGVNDLPTSAGGSISTAEDVTKTFAASDFAFSDVDTGDTLASVRIDTLPAFGTLELSGTDVTAGDVIAVADIGNLTYTPPANASGSSSFTYSVNDGTGFATSPATMSLSVSAVNDSPRNLRVSGDLTIMEAIPGGTIGTVSASDPDDSVLTYTVSDTRFEINSDNVLKLKNTASLDYESEETVTLTLTASDISGATATRQITIAVLDVNELPGSDDQDNISGGPSDDFVRSLGGNDTIDTGDGRDTIDGGNGDDHVSGGGDDDFLKGSAGRDTVEGGGGNDLVFAGFGDQDSDTVRGNDGLDTLGGGAGDDLVDGGENDDLLWGRSGDDTVIGGEGDDTIWNGEGSDTVNGGNGDDDIWASQGDDVLTGGAGDDTFLFGSESGNDTITDFSLVDDTLDFQVSGAGFANLADVQAAASNTTIDGASGLLIDYGDGLSVFLIGLSTDDLASMNIVF